MAGHVRSATGPLDFSYLEALLLDLTGYNYSIRDKAKTLRKFGKTANADAGVKTTVADFQGSVVNETYATSNSIDSIVSDNASDTGQVSVEGHVVDMATGDMSFLVQHPILTGQTPVTLTTPLYRCTRIYRSNGTFLSPTTELVGNVYAYDSTLAGGVTGGTPNTATATKCMIVAGNQNSTKCATSISSTDVWMVTHITAGLERLSGSGTRGDVNIEIRNQGGVFRNIGGEVVLSTTAGPYAEVNYETPIIVLPNSDIRMVATVDTNNSSVFGEIDGFLAKRTGIDGLD